MASRRFVSDLALANLLAAVYFVAGKLGLMLAFVNPSATAVWPPTGIALAAFLLWGSRIWPGILLGAFLVNVTTSSSVPASITIALGNTLEGWAGAYLVNRFARGLRAFDSPMDNFRFAVLAGLLGTSVSATIGTTSLVLNGLAAWEDYAPVWLTWWLGDAGGALIVAPVIVLWAENPRPRWNSRRVLEPVFLLLSSILAGMLVFGGLPPLSTKNYALEFLIMPCIVWAAFRFGQREAATVTFILSGIAIWGTLHDFGPFARDSVNEGLLLLQAFMGTMTVAGLGMAAAVSERRKLEAAGWEVNEKLERGLDELAQRNHQMAVLNEIGRRLQSCLTVKEAYAILKQSGPQLFPNGSGALYVKAALQNRVEAAVVWGETSPMRRAFAPNDCWALRRGQIHLSGTASADLVCAHLTGSAAPASLCLPMIGQGEILGVLQLQSAFAESWTETRQRLAQTMADSVALTLANLWLHESLRQQSIRDPLTGLFNRRYLEECLERELPRATRGNYPVGVILFDLDNFKNFNDTFGHAGGDLLLSKLGGLLQEFIRSGDIACRWGGEEFVLLLPEVSLETAEHRAEQLRKQIKQLQVFCQGKPLGPVSVSVGVAAFPQHGSSSHALLQVVDRALYRAKHDGRDRIEVAESSRTA